MYTDYLKKEVVIDTDGPFIYLGTLEFAGEGWIEMTDVDVHDRSDASSTKEVYIRKALITGIRPNRKRCRIERDKIISVSLFSDIESF